jgi:uncharacterized protein
MLMSPPRRVFLDTSFVIALSAKDDPHHARAKAWDQALRSTGTSAVLHLGVVLEIGDGFSRLNRRAKGMEFVDRLLHEEGFEVFMIDESLLGEAAQLYLTWLDKEWGLTDCTSFTLMNQLGVREALTADIHFQQAGFDCLLLRDPN